MRTTIALFLLLGACDFRSRSLLNRTVDSGADSMPDEAPLLRPDARADVPEAMPDAHPPMADAAPSLDGIIEVLTCGFDEQTALRAAVRRSACDFSGRFSVKSLMEAWEGGLWGHWDLTLGNYVGYDITYGCEIYRCLANATSCTEARACIDPTGGACLADYGYCDGDRLMKCRADDRPGVEVIDCAAFGATCVEEVLGHGATQAQCALGDCRFGSNYYGLECDGNDLTLCDGAIRSTCGAWTAGTSCGSFYIGGELPTVSCMFNTGVPGAYAGDGAGYEVMCDANAVMSFSTTTGRSYTFDCRANGYPDCLGRGCALLE